MNWLAKVAAYKAMSLLPGCERLYNFYRNKISKSILPDRARVGHRLDIGVKYLETLEQLGAAGRLKAGAHLDFGCGWQPAIPLLYYSIGCERQFLFDANPSLDAASLDATIAAVLEVAVDPAWPHKGMIKRLPKRDPGRSLNDHLESMGISYLAPCSGRFAELKAVIDVITCTGVLYYIGRDELKALFASINASLRKGGFFVATVRLDDEYADTDPTICRHNFLRYSPWIWENLINSRLISYNRLRAPDYRELLEGAGLNIRLFEVTGPTAAEREALQKIPVHPCFDRYSQEDLVATEFTFVATKP